MKTAIYNTDKGPISIQYDENAPCRICKKPVWEASVGGVDICPACDAGFPKDEIDDIFLQKWHFEYQYDFSNPPKEDKLIIWEVE